MEGIGEILKKEREEQGITLDDVAEVTKIRYKYLEAIENEQFQVLPGEVYARGFVTAYLKYLGIKDREDVKAIMESKPKAEPVLEVKEAEPEHKGLKHKHKSDDELFEEPPVARLKQPQKKMPAAKFEEKPLNKKGALIIVLSVVAILILLGLQWIYSASQEAEEPKEEPVKQETQKPVEDEKDDAEDVDAEKPADVAVPNDGKLHVTLEIIDLYPESEEACWIGFDVDGKKTQATLKEGQKQELVASNAVSLNVGNAGVVKVTVNGKDMGILGAESQVVEITYTAEEFLNPPAADPNAPVDPNAPAEPTADAE